MSSIHIGSEIVCEAVLDSARSFPVVLVDLGCGLGFYGKILREIPNLYLVGVDGYLPNLEEAAPYYDEVHYMELRDFLSEMGRCDFLLMMDIVEHFDREEALWIIEQAKRKADYVFLSTPKCFFENTLALMSNPYERHRCLISPSDMSQLGFGTAKYGLINNLYYWRKGEEQ